MTRHYIIMSSSYTDGKRIALDITEDSRLNTDSIESIFSEIKRSCDEDVPLSTHYIQTEAASWRSVQQYDPFFEDVECVSSVTEFARKIKTDRDLKGLDVANYIASQVLCTHVKLEKLVYLAYADYLCSFQKKLFEDSIYAFTYGPVVDSVYSMYRQSGYAYIDPKEYDDDKQQAVRVEEMPAKSRILFAKDGVEKKQSIDATIRKYRSKSGSQLIDITHRKGSPWSFVDSTKMYQVISDDLILKHHSIEQ